MNRWLAAVRSLLYGALFLAAWIWLALQARGLDAVLGFRLPGWTRPVGGALMGLGALVALGCAASLVAGGRGTPAPFDPPRELVTGHVYRWVRNPMYLGGTIFLLGFGLWHRSPAMALFSALFLVAAHFYVRLREEPVLEDRFGERYRAYRERVNRWLPAPPRRKEGER